jgi:hypothetical protein
LILVCSDWGARCVDLSIMNKAIIFTSLLKCMHKLEEGWRGGERRRGEEEGGGRERRGR